MYKDTELLRECWESASARWQKEDVCDQVIEGFCAFASINSILSAIFEGAFFLQFPSKAGPMTLQQMADTLKLKLIEDGTVKSEFADIEIEDIRVVIMDPAKVSLKDFEGMIEEMSDTKTEDGSRVYLIANFCRSPLFFSHEPWMKRWAKWVMTGHFSPMLSHCRDAQGAMYILVGDVNAKYGHWLVRSDRMYEAMKCREVLNGASRRGLLRIQVRKNRRTEV